MQWTARRLARCLARFTALHGAARGRKFRRLAPTAKRCEHRSLGEVAGVQVRQATPTFAILRVKPAHKAFDRSLPLPRGPRSGNRRPMARLVLISLLLGACSSTFVPATHRPDGGWHLECGGMLDRCVQHADNLCKGRGYMVLGGQSKRKLYGAELGVSQVEERHAELDVACADKRGDLPKIAPAGPTLTRSPSSETPVP